MAQEDTVARGLFRDFGSNLGQFLVPFAQQCNADCIILGGSISTSFALFAGRMKEILAAAGLKPVILASRPDGTAALAGSARLCDNDFYNQVQ